MRGYFGYIRVSTVRQGEKGSSLQEQKIAIEGYAHRSGMKIVRWFEEQETAAKLGRPVFNTMLAALQQGLAAGVITHKIDRSARNLRDWASLGELLDRGIELHFAHENIDLSSRGGRLSADIQAVVAADYVRNLRDEVRKGLYGRLKQGIYPFAAPIGYLNHGGGKPKTIDPIRGPLIQKAFVLYATGAWSLQTVADELRKLGLRTRSGATVRHTGFSAIFNNPFYIGLIRIKKSDELFQGTHEPLVDKALFDDVQNVLKGRLTHRARGHRFRYQRTLRCASCRLSLTASRHKGRVYYRCQTRTCPTTCIREDRIDGALGKFARHFHFTDDEWKAVGIDAEKILAEFTRRRTGEIDRVSFAVAATDDRLGRLSDAYIDAVFDKETYLKRKEKLLHDRAALISRKASLEAGNGGLQGDLNRILELTKSLGNMAAAENDTDFRDLLKSTTSNLAVQGKNLVVTWANPFCLLVDDEPVLSGGHHRCKPRTERLERLRKFYSALVRASDSVAGSRPANFARIDRF